MNGLITYPVRLPYKLVGAFAGDHGLACEILNTETAADNMDEIDGGSAASTALERGPRQARQYQQTGGPLSALCAFVPRPCPAFVAFQANKIRDRFL